MKFDTKSLILKFHVKIALNFFKEISKKKSKYYKCLFQLPDDEFAELYSVFQSIPALKMDVDVKVEDDDHENKITAGSIVTISTKLTHQTMGDITEAAGKVRFSNLRRIKKNKLAHF